MIDGISKELLNYGVAVTILIPVLTFFLWAGRTIVVRLIKNMDDFFDGVIEQQKKVTESIRDLAQSFISIRENCLDCRQSNLSALREAEVRLTTRLIDVSAAANDRTFGQLKELLTDLDRNFQSSLTNTANSIRDLMTESALKNEAARLRRENEELSRPHVVGALPR
jgi:hypothetical protein